MVKARACFNMNILKFELILNIRIVKLENQFFRGFNLCIYINKTA